MRRPSLSSSFSLSLMKFTQKVNVAKREEKRRESSQSYEMFSCIITPLVNSLMTYLLSKWNCLVCLQASRIVLLSFYFFISSSQFIVWPLFFIDCFISISFSFSLLYICVCIYIYFTAYTIFYSSNKNPEWLLLKWKMREGGEGEGAVQRWLK